MSFVDRGDACRRMAEQLRFLRGADVVVLGLPRGGVPVASRWVRQDLSARWRPGSGRGAAQPR